MKRIISFIVAAVLICANASAFAQDIWGSREETYEAVTDAKKESCFETISWVETLGNCLYFKGRACEKAGEAISIGVFDSMNNAVELMQRESFDNGFYCFIVSDNNFIGGSVYNVKVSCCGSTISYDYYHRTAEDDAELLNKINGGNISEVINDTRMNLNLYNYDKLSVSDKADVTKSLSSKSYGSISGFVSDFYRAVGNTLKLNQRLYISESGNDENDGTSESPFKTVGCAYRAANEIINSGVYTDIEIILEDGSYYIDEELMFNRDNTDSSRNITVKAQNAGKAVISGGEKISGFVPYKDNIYVKNIGAGKDIGIVYNHGGMMWPARYPNRGSGKYDLPEDYAAVAGKYTNPKNGIYTSGMPYVSDADGMQIGIWSNGGNNNSWMWYFNIMDVASYDYSSGLITYDKQTNYDSGIGAKYYLQNAIEFLDAENEFYYDKKSGSLYVYSRNINSIDISVPRVQNIIECVGASNVTIDGLVLENTDRTKDYSYSYKTNDTGCGVKISDSDNITVSNCIIRNVGGHGVYLVNSGKSNLITGNDIYNTYSTGISCNGEGNSTFTDNIISNNHVHSTGLIIPSSTGIALYHAGAENTVITNNLVHDSPRSAIRVEKVNAENHITYNDLYDVNKGSQDTGVIYTYGLGKNAKTHIENNYIHDSKSYIEKTIALYIDDYSYGTIAKNNIIYNMQKNDEEDIFGYCIYAKGDNAVIENNYIVGNPTSGAVIGSYAQHSSADNISIMNNVAADSGDVMYYHVRYDDNRLKISDNNITDAENPKVIIGGEQLTWSEWVNTYGKDQNSLTAQKDIISDIVRKDFRLLKAYPGVNDINIRDMGLTGDFIYNTADMPDRVYVRGQSQDEDKISIDAKKGQSIRLDALSRDASGMIVKDAEYTFESDNESVASVNDGVVTVLGTGKAKITVTASGRGGSGQSYIYINASESNSEIKNVICYDLNGSKVTSAGSSIKSISADIFCDTDGTDTAAAVYDRSGRLLSVCTKKVDAGSKNIVYDVGYTGTDAAEVKLFIWNFKTLYPIFFEKILFTD